MHKNTYDAAFFQYVNSGAIASARNILPLIKEQFNITSVVDFGCGQGAWLKVWEELGVEDFLGVDGEYVDKKYLLIDRDKFISHDLKTSINLERRFDIVQSLEVAEHLPHWAAKEFVGSLVTHGDIILFSAAPRGQGGHGHINEQSYEYWRDIFNKYEYLLVDFLRPIIKDRKYVEPWYRFNTFLFINKILYQNTPLELMNYIIPENEEIPDVSPLWYRTRKKILQLLPIPLATNIARIKEKLVFIKRKNMIQE